MSDFRVGQKVVYIGIQPGLKYATPVRRDVGSILTVGAVYEVRAIGVYQFIIAGGDAASHDRPAVWVKGVIRNTQSLINPDDIRHDIPWDQKMFKPLEEKPESIELFRTIGTKPIIPDDAPSQEPKRRVPEKVPHWFKLRRTP